MGIEPISQPTIVGAHRLRSSVLSIRRTTSEFMTSLLANFGCGGLDLHQRSSGYEPDEILLLYPAIKLWWGGLDSNQLRFYVPDLQSGAHPPSEQPPQYCYNSILY